MNITLCNAFRNSLHYLIRYTRQAYELQAALNRRGDNLHMIWGEGDSTDKTLTVLKLMQNSNGFNAEIVDCTHGGEVFGSVVDAQRFKQLAYVGNCIYRHIPQNCDILLHVESDLIYESDTMLRLIDQTKEYPAISPMIMLDRPGWNGAFYDTHCFIKNGKHFEHYPPHCDGWPYDMPFRVDSAGSCMSVRGDIARQLVWNEDVFIGVCSQIYALGESVWCNPKLSVIHS